MELWIARQIHENRASSRKYQYRAAQAHAARCGNLKTDNIPGNFASS